MGLSDPRLGVINVYRPPFPSLFCRQQWPQIRLKRGREGVHKYLLDGSTAETGCSRKRGFRCESSHSYSGQQNVSQIIADVLNENSESRRQSSVSVREDIIPSSKKGKNSNNPLDIDILSFNFLYVVLLAHSGSLAAASRFFTRCFEM
jgi:hypothetical protein